MHNDFLTMSPSPAAYVASLPSDVLITAAIWTSEVCASASDLFRYAAPVMGDARFLLSVEDCGCVAPEDVSVFPRLGVALAGLTWNDENRYGGGAYSYGTLTAEGAALCRYLSAHHIYIDTAHMNDETFYAVYDLGVAILDSHTAFSACHRHARAISFDRASRILRRGGKIGITLVDDFFGGGTEAWLAQVDTFAQRFGCDGLCIGTDFWGAERYVSESLNNDYENLSELVEKLREMGYNEDNLRKIFAENYRSLWSEPLCTNTTTIPSTPDTRPPK